MRRNPGQLASENATEAPPDDIDRAVLLVEFVDALDDAVEDLWRGSEVASEIPAVGGVAESIEGAPQRHGGAVAGKESRHDEHGPVARGSHRFTSGADIVKAPSSPTAATSVARRRMEGPGIRSPACHECDVSHRFRPSLSDG